jgi:SpoIID/LytB domain protein
MPASWNTEALKSQAIAARTYVTRNSFRVNDTQGNQVYGGIEETDYQKKISEVVEATRGKVLKIGTSFVDTVYSSSNGGYKESNQGAWGYSQLSYLKAGEDNFDPKTRWDISLKQDQISLQGYNLSNPESWWNNVQEADSIVRNTMKAWLKNQLGLPKTSDIKILSIENLTIHPERTDGKRIISSSVEIRYIEKSNTSYSKDTNGNINIKTYKNTSLPGNQMRAMFGTMSMKSLLVDTIESPTSTDINRINGSDRIATSVEVSKQLYPNGFPTNHSHKTVLIATSKEYADALSAGPLAYQSGNAPILLTNASSLSSSVIEEIKRLKASKVIVLGGKDAVSDQVINQIKAIVDPNRVSRISGDNRYETNAEINEKLTNVDGLFVASGQNFADALAGSSVAAINHYAIVLTREGALPAINQTYISKQTNKPIYILGGIDAISDTVLQQVRKVKADASRLSGSNRYGTLAEILEQFKQSFNGTEVIYSTGINFPDALTSSSLAAAKKAPLILVGSELSTKLDSFLTHYQANLEQINVLGGTVAISEEKVNQLKDKLGVITTLRLGGTGFGHGVGMSQYGAQARASEGHSYTQILTFYYPGTNIENIY